jgi:MFS family permease
LRVLFATFAGSLDTNALVPIIALYAALLGADLVMTGIIVGMYSIIHAPANLLFGRIVDRMGKRWPLVGGLLWDAVSILLYALAQNPIQLLLARVSHGLGGGMVGPSSMSFLADTSTAERRGRAMALYGISIATAVIVGFSLSGVLVARAGFTRAGYESVFYVVFGILVAGAATAATVPEPPRPVRKEGVEAGAVNRPALVSAYVAIFSLYFILGAFTTLVPLHIGALGLGKSAVPMAFMVFAVFSVSVHYPAGRLTDMWGPLVPVTVGLALAGAAMILLAPANLFVLVVVTMVMFGTGHGLVFPSASAMVASSTRAGTMGLSTGAFYTVLVAGVALGAPAMALVADVLGIGLALQLSGLASVAGIVIVTIMLTRSRASALPS